MLSRISAGTWPRTSAEASATEASTPIQVDRRLLLTLNGWRVSGAPRCEAEKRVRCTRGSGGLSIHFFAIGDSDDEHHQFGIND